MIKLSGKKFGRLCVEQKSDFQDGKGILWVCTCSCGKHKNIRSKHLIQGNTTSCGCFQKEQASTAAKQNNRKENPKSASIVNLYSICRYGAKKRQIDFNLSIDEFEKLIFNKCYCCGSNPNQMFSAYFRQDGSLSAKAIRQKIDIQDLYYKQSIIYVNGVDRIDNCKGYVPGNVAACCYNCNIAKAELSIDDFINHVKKIVEFQKEKNVENN